MKNKPQDVDILNIGIKANTAIANIGIVLIIFSFISLVIFPSWQGLSVFAFSIFMVFMPHKIRLDYSKRSYKIYQDFYIIRLGKELPFSKFKSLLLKKSVVSGRFQSRTRDTPYSVSSYDVTILLGNTESILVGEFKDYKGALERAKTLSQKLST